MISSSQSKESAPTSDQTTEIVSIAQDLIDIWHEYKDTSSINSSAIEKTQSDVTDIIQEKLK